MSDLSWNEKLEIHEALAEDAYDSLLQELRLARSHLDSAMDHALWCPNNNGVREKITKLIRGITEIRIQLIREEA